MLVGRSILAILVGIHWILPFTPANQHEETRIIVASLILGAAFLSLWVWSYRRPARAFATSTGLLGLVIAVSSITEASPLAEGAVVKALFLSGLCLAAALAWFGRQGKSKRRIGFGAMSLVAVAAVLTGSRPVGGQGPVEEGVEQVRWTLLYAEDFSTPLDQSGASWVRENYSRPFDTITYDAGLWYQNVLGPDWHTAFSSFATYRKEFPVGQDGWLTASLSARDRNRDGVIEAPPSIRTLPQSVQCVPFPTNPTLGWPACEMGTYVAVLDVPDYTGGAIFRSTEALPQQYRIEYNLKTIDFGGKRRGSIYSDGRINGYSPGGCKTLHPWASGSRTSGWTGDASLPPCEWQSVREGPRAYNGFHFLAIVDVRRSGASEQSLLALPPEGSDGCVFPASRPCWQRDGWSNLRFSRW